MRVEPLYHSHRTGANDAGDIHREVFGFPTQESMLSPVLSLPEPALSMFEGDRANPVSNKAAMAYRVR